MKKISHIFLPEDVYTIVASCVICQDGDKSRFVPQYPRSVSIDMNNVVIRPNNVLAPPETRYQQPLTHLEYKGPAPEQTEPKEEAKSRQIGGSHYSGYAIQPFEYTYKNKLGWAEGEALKYLTRHRDKGGKQDLKKAIHILEMLMEAEYGGKE